LIVSRVVPALSGVFQQVVVADGKVSLWMTAVALLGVKVVARHKR